MTLLQIQHPSSVRRTHPPMSIRAVMATAALTTQSSSAVFASRFYRNPQSFLLRGAKEVSWFYFALKCLWLRPTKALPVPRDHDLGQSECLTAPWHGWGKDAPHPSAGILLRGTGRGQWWMLSCTGSSHMWTSVLGPSLLVLQHRE